LDHPVSAPVPGRDVTALEVIAGHDLSGKEAIVTGGTSGLGYQTALALATAGAQVVVTSRDPARGGAAAAALRAHTGNQKVVYRQLDLTSIGSVTGWARRHAAAGRPLHILVNNAGVMAPPVTRTADGFELQFGVNHLAHFALTCGLLPALRAAGSARVICLTSSAHRRSDIDYGDPNYRRRPYDPWQAYGQSKTANALFAAAFTTRVRGQGVTANAVMPGAIRTGLQRHLSAAQLRERGWLDAEGGWAAAGWKTAEQGAATSVWAAVAPELEGAGGRYLEDCAIAVPWTGPGQLPGGHYLPYAMDPGNAGRLWELSSRLLNHLPDGQ
jgi:NAD(P)-dependent dehydrogenase (short-subunit alcohol dehydrogenase family)